MVNVLGVVCGKGRSRDALVFIAGRDDLPPGPGANDNGSGTGALVELARTLVGSVTQTSLVFASVDGTTAESAGARELARHPPGGLKLRAGVALRAVGRPGGPLVLRLSGEGHRLPAAGWLRTVEQALRDEGVQEVRLPSLGQQVAALVAPVVHGDQAALVGTGAAVVGLDGSRARAELRSGRHGRRAARRPPAALRRPSGPRRHRHPARRAGVRHRAAAGEPRLDLPRLQRSCAARLDARALPGRAADTARLRPDRRRGASACARRAPLAHRAARALAGRRPRDRRARDPPAGCDWRAAGHALTALCGRRGRRGALADRLSARARRRLRRARCPPRTGRLRHGRRGPLPGRARLSARGGCARIRR